MITEDTPLECGKYKFLPLKRVPADYLVNLHKYHSIKGELYDWLDQNIESLRARMTKEAEPLQLPCEKISYYTKDIAKSELRRIINLCTPGRRKPVRVYECSECGGWHLTSKPLR